MKPVISLTVEVQSDKPDRFRDNAAIFILSMCDNCTEWNVLLPYFNVINTFPPICALNVLWQ